VDAVVAYQERSRAIVARCARSPRRTRRRCVRRSRTAVGA
jgi:hypothetical protein